MSSLTKWSDQISGFVAQSDRRADKFPRLSLAIHPKIPSGLDVCVGSAELGFTMSFNLDELELPQWVNSDFLRTVIEESGKGKNVQIHNYESTPATALGDHFASIMFRIKVTFAADEITNGVISLILKTCPDTDGLKKELLETIDVFDREIYMYTKVLNECRDILKKCGYTDLLAPRVLYSSLTPHKVIVFEDLKELGYFMLPHNVPDEYEIRLVFSKLAQLHAVTFKMNADGRNDFHLKGTVFGFSYSRRMDFFLTGPKFLAEVMESLPGFESCASKLRKITAEWLMDKCVKAVNQPAAYSVLNHGDFHIRNMMFKRNEFNAISEIALVDFQIPHWGSPAYDLVYMAGILPYEFREIAFRHYFNIFIDVLVKTGYEGELPTYEQLQEEIKAYSYLELYFQSTLALFVYRDRSNINVQTEAIMSDPVVRRSLYNDETYIAHIKETVPKLLDSIDIE
ncbi:unnamed protein product [Hermetia illucens]|uniref:CHK kinase-like domain-containing protein n=1 Tax=Hermetia illucens TaxID=343691 RepID=A0A7R8V6J9_HERIL|nr:uncharacterized protein LOC119658615 [Hermetia illucens]CAD7093758.1 unnamed protein product [Hermetia illucens]